MKKSIKIIISLGLVIVAAFAFIAVANAKTPSIAGSESVEQAIADLGISEGEICVLEQLENDHGDKQYVYSDSKYTYYMDADDSELVFAVMNTDKLSKLLESSLDIIPIERTKADELFENYLRELFPQYNRNNIIVNVITNNGSPLDYYIYEVQETSEDIILNRANIAFGIDGSLTSFGGTYNKIEESIGSDKFSANEISIIAYNYLSSKKDQIEQSMLPDDNPGTDVKTNGGEGVILPDGIMSIDDMVEEQLPKYKIYLDSAKDLKNITLSKEIHNDRVVWFVHFNIDTSWGEVDEMFNSLISMEIDATTGAVIEVISTDGA